MTDPATLLEMLETSAEAYGDRPALTSRVGDDWQSISYRGLRQLARQVASGLHRLGIRPGDRVAIAAESCPRWVVCDFGILMAGAVNVGMFPSLPAAQMEAILSDSGAWLLIVGDQKLLQKALAIRQTMPDLQIVLMQGEPPEDCGVLAFDALLASDDAFTPPPVAPDDLASLVYTSGTTGEQKGVMLTHANFVANVHQSRQVLAFEPDDVLLSVLPLNHVFERTAGCYLPLRCGSQVVYAENLRRLRELLGHVRPMYMILVPRFLEALHDALIDRVGKSPPLRRKLFHWAMEAGRRRLRYRLRGRRVPAHVAAQYALAQRLVLNNLRARLGLDRCIHLVSGAAALAPEINEFFQSLGIEVLEGYGLTEAAPVVAVNRPGAVTIGTVGLPLPGVEVRLGDQNEILVRGPNVMTGYYGMAEATAAAVDAEGWLHTGDIGTLDDAGRLSITDRLKDLLVLTNGKNVAPQPIEMRLCASPYIAQAVVLGDREAFVTALVVPHFERLEHWAQAQGLTLPSERGDVIEQPAVQALMRDEVRRLTSHLADFEMIRAFRLLAQEFTIESGELTATMKVKRRVVVEHYGGVITEMYGR